MGFVCGAEQNVRLAEVRLAFAFRTRADGGVSGGALIRGRRKGSGYDARPVMRFRATFRLTAFLLLTLVVCVIWYLGTFFVSDRVRWRQRAFHSWAQGFVVISNMKVEIVGIPPEPPFFLVSNHLGYADIAVIRSVVSGVFVAKSEVRDWFLVGRIIRDMGMIFVDRNNRRDIVRAGAQIISKLDDGEGVIVFPEGTSTKGEHVLPFKSSFLQFAAERDVPVSYLSISYRTDLHSMPASKLVCWWDDTPFLVHLWRLFQLKELYAYLNFGEEPIRDPDRKKLASELHTKINEGFIPVE